MKRFNSLLLIIFIASITSCDIADNEAIPEESFFRIYDNDLFNSSFIPIDVAQTADDGFIILSGSRLNTSNFTGVNLIKLDKEGQFVSEEQLDEQYVNPVDQLVELNGQYYFLAMNSTSLQMNLFTVNDSAKVANITPVGGLTYPMYLNQDGDGLLSLSYNNNNKQTIISRISADGQIANSQGYTIGAGNDTEEPIIDHFTRTGKQLPFFAGSAGGGNYFFNGFYNFTLSLVFTNFGDEPIGVVQGQQADGGMSSGISLSGSTFALSRFNFGDNFIIPTINLNATGISSATDFTGNSFPELQPDAKVELGIIDVDGKQSIIYASNTKSGQIILMAYDPSTTTLSGTKYLGSTYPYEISGFTQTSDGGLAVAGTTSVAGRFDRICLFKLSKEELSDLIN